jgi:5-formyltetrahydrofolate cyclo-ligase
VEDKELLRAGVLDRRRRMPAAARVSAGAQLATHAPAVAQRAASVAAYAGVGTEPPTRALLEALRALGVRVLLPVVCGRSLDWGEFTTWTALRRAPLGLLEPSGARLGPAAAADVTLVLVPALAVDRCGHRLGRGGGFYDRWLMRVPRSRRIAVVYDGEVLPDVPHDAHDQPVGHVLTPKRGVVALGQ